MQTFLRACPRCRLSVTTVKSHSLRLRHFSSSPQSSSSADPTSIAEAFLSKFSKGQTYVRKQLLDSNQLRLFSLTLNRPHLWPSSKSTATRALEETEPLSGTPLPPAYHLIYFTPAQLPGTLGVDGTDASFNPDTPFTRRMWAGGSFHWPGANPNAGTQSLLRVGDTVTEVTKVLKCEPKVIHKTGESMLVVGIEKEFRNSKDELCVLDRRNWVFRAALDPSNPAAIAPKPAELARAELDEAAQGKTWREFTQSEATLFRVSALTFNAHRIHYDKPWATEVEGHRNVVVHGPLNLIAMLDLWRDTAVSRGMGSSQEEVVYPQKIDYRATSPVYAGESYRVMMNEGAVKHKETEINVVSNDGTRCMKGIVTDWSSTE